MTELLMEPKAKMRRGSHCKSFMKMFDRSVCPEDLLLLAKADYMGRLGPGMDRDGLIPDYEETERKLGEMFALYLGRMNRPCVMGRDLVAEGIQPEPLLGEALAYAHKLRLAGCPKEE